jgi:hypothetical protein
MCNTQPLNFTQTVALEIELLLTQLHVMWIIQWFTSVSSHACFLFNTAFRRLDSGIVLRLCAYSCQTAEAIVKNKVNSIILLIYCSNRLLNTEFTSCLKLAFIAETIPVTGRLWDEDLTLYRQSAHRWRWGCQTFELVAPYSQETSIVCYWH